MRPCQRVHLFYLILKVAFGVFIALYGLATILIHMSGSAGASRRSGLIAGGRFFHNRHLHAVRHRHGLPIRVQQLSQQFHILSRLNFSGWLLRENNLGRTRVVDVKGFCLCDDGRWYARCASRSRTALELICHFDLNTKHELLPGCGGLPWTESEFEAS